MYHEGNPLSLLYNPEGLKRLLWRVFVFLIFGAMLVRTVSPTPQALTSVLIPHWQLAPSQPFDPNVGAPLPDHRIVALYGIPGAPPSGPAATLGTPLLDDLAALGKKFTAADASHPVMLGLDVVVQIPDPCEDEHDPTCSHWVDKATIDQYIEFCQRHHLLLFLDLNFGRSSVRTIVSQVLPYLQRYAFVQLALDPEWAVGPEGYPGVDLGHLMASDINWVSDQLAAIPTRYHVPRKVLLIHEFRADVLPDSDQIMVNPEVSLVVHLDSVGNYAEGADDKMEQYHQWIDEAKLAQGKAVPYGGFKVFPQLEAPFHLMNPQEIVALKPAPLVVTYGL